MRLALFLLLTLAARAQSDPFAGVFQGDRVSLELKGSAGKYTGNLTVQGQQFPAAVTASGTTATGTFTAGGRAYKFTLIPHGNGYKLASEGVEYLLARKVESTTQAPGPATPPPTVSPRPATEDAPAPAGAIQTTPPPSAPPSSIVGS